jgi:hypothetical protein
MSYPTFAPAGVLIEQPAGPQYPNGLYSASTVLPPDDTVRWEIGGVFWSADTCAGGGLWPGAYCQPEDLPGSWTMTHGSLPTGMAVAQPDAANRPFDVSITPPTPASGTVTDLLIDYGDGNTTSYPVPLPGPVLYTYTEPTSSPVTYPITVTYTYSGTGQGTPQTTTVTFTGTGPVQRTKDAWGVVWQAATPFVIYNAIQCAPVGMSDATVRANARLGWNEHRLVERGFFLGEQGNRTALATNATTALTPLEASDPGLDIFEALGVIESAAQNATNTQLVIHAPRALAAWASHERLVFRDGSQLVTPLGNLWAFGAGYGYEGPDGTAHPEQAWLYATGEMVIRRSQVVSNEVFSAPTNLALAVAERAVLVTAECTQVAAKVAFLPAPVGAAALIPSSS